MTDPRSGVLHRYADRLPLTDATPRITLNEGGTPLIRSQRLERELGLRSLHFKFEGLNPTGSFKDRGMVMAIAHALEERHTTVICASTGNTSASAAAYAARFGLRCIVVIPDGRIAAGKLAQAQVFGAEIISIDGNFDAALATVRELAARHAVSVVNSINPFRIEGQKTAAFEIVDDLGEAPDVVVLPVGNAGNITAYWRGFTEYHRDGLIGRLPRMVGAQAAGAAPLVHGAIVTDPETIATAIRIGNPASWEPAVAAQQQSEGFFAAVGDDAIRTAQRRLASTEGVFCEPASAASIALLIEAVADGRIEAGARVVCILTGNGLKDIATAAQGLPQPRRAEATAESLATMLELS